MHLPASAWRECHWGRTTGNKALMAQLATLLGRVAQLEVELAGRPLAGPTASTQRLWEALLAVKQERDELAVQLA